MVLFDFYVFRADRLLVVLGLRLEIFLVTRDLDRRHVGFGIGFMEVPSLLKTIFEGKRLQEKKTSTKNTELGSILD